MRQFLDFEKSVAELDNKISELKQMCADDSDGLNISEEIIRLTEKADRQLYDTYMKLTPWQKVQVARHSQRPHAEQYIRQLIESFMPLAGDRLYADDHAVVGGIGRFCGQTVVVIGTERGQDLDSRLKHNFGMAKPDGYRKAQRLVKFAIHFHLPVITFVDTSGAWPGIDAEERGQAEAIARSIDLFLSAPVPIIAVIIGEGGSGGAVALAGGDRILMLEYSVYSVISPEACASILWRDPKQASVAANALKMTAQDLLSLNLIDTIIKEPVGGAHRDPELAIQRTGEKIAEYLSQIVELDPSVLISQRREKFLIMGKDTK